MRRFSLFLVSLLRFLGLSVLSAFLVIARYLLRTPQPIIYTSDGQECLFSWTYGHVSYKVLGAANATPLVMLHTPEIGGSSYEFHALAEALAHYYHVYLLDLLGFGLSNRPPIHYSSETYTTLYEDFLTNVVQRPAIIMASGLSCNYSIALASTHPELCQRLVLLSPHTLFKASSQQTSMGKVIQQPLLALALYSFLTIRPVLHQVMAFQQGIVATSITKDDLDHTYSMAHQFGAEHAVVALLAGRLWLDVTQQARTLAVPMLLLWGASTAQADWSIAELYAEDEQTQSAFIVQAGLRPHQDQPEEVLAKILQWLASTEARITTIASTGDRTEEARAEEKRDAMSEISDAPTVTGHERIDGKEQELNEEVANTGPDEQIEAYCVKCKQKRFMVNPVSVVTKNGRNAKSGTCPICDTKLFRFVSA